MTSSRTNTFLFFILLSFTALGLKAQVPTYNQLISVISSRLPESNVSGKLIAFVSWSAANTTSRDVNKEFNRIGTIYQGAKLRNGEKGIYVISCNVDDPSTASIAWSRDGINFSIHVQASDFGFLKAARAGSNVVYDGTAARIYENLTQSQVLPSFNQLITR